jgi:hypothetical protein
MRAQVAQVVLAAMVLILVMQVKTMPTNGVVHTAVAVVVVLVAMVVLVVIAALTEQMDL